MLENKDESIPHVLSDTQRAYLRSLAPNPVWQSIIITLAQHPQLPAYRKAASDPHGQFYNWVFESGRLRAYDQMIHVLTNGKASLSQPLVDTEEN